MSRKKKSLFILLIIVLALIPVTVVLINSSISEEPLINNAISEYPQLVVPEIPAGTISVLIAFAVALGIFLYRNPKSNH